MRHRGPRTRQQLREADGVLRVWRTPVAAAPSPGQPAIVGADPREGDELLLAVWDDGSVTALHGHVDLGTGLATALSQIVAEELDADVAQVHMVLGDTASAPNQGATIASASIQVHADPLRQAAALARRHLLASNAGGNADAAPLAGQQIDLWLPAPTELPVPTKATADYRIVGRSQPRIDIPAKATGELVFVHDLRRPGMLHGRVVRPPYAGADHGDFIGNTLDAVDRGSIEHLPGIVEVVVIRDFVGIVAEREEVAEAAMRELDVRWKPWPGMPALDDVAQAIRDNPSTHRRLVDRGDVDGSLADVAVPMPRRYLWPYQLHASIGPSCAVAEWQTGEGSEPTLRVWAGTQNPHVLRADLALLMGLEPPEVDVVRMEAAGCYGRNGADDVAADAALLARAVGRPVRVQLTREQEHLWEPKGAAQLMDVNGGLNADGSVAAVDFQTSYPSNGAPTLALLLTRTIEPKAEAFEMGDRTAVPPYDYQHLRVGVNDMAPILRASWLRGVSALPNSFAHESYIDELAIAAHADPVEFRLRHLPDPRAAELVRATADRAGWITHCTPQQQSSDGPWLKGQGFAYARYVHSRFPGFGAAWAAWVADVDVHRETGEVAVRRVVVGHDAGLMVNPAGVVHQIHGNVIQTTSRALKEKVELAPAPRFIPVSREWGSYPILRFDELPVIDVMTMPRPNEPPLGAGESASVPGTAAIANAIFDATGIRFREPPFTAEVVRAALHPLPGPAPSSASSVPAAPAGQRSDAASIAALAPRRRRGLWATALALASGAVGVAMALAGWRPAIAPIDIAVSSARSTYAPELIERGRVLAAVGDCAVCHTAADGAVNAGGRAIETPFGIVYSTNLTPDAETGLGHWSFSAFQRAMREGRSRDGHALYPAFPYTAYTRVTDDDLLAIYAFLMSQPAVRAPTPPAAMRFPFNLRPLVALWNALFLDPGPLTPRADQSAEWNRGAYLVEGLGHCAACHSPRNALGAEQRGERHFAGAIVNGWEAPPLTSLSYAPLPWTESELFRYLRFGHSPGHGIAGGPMAAVVRELSALPDADVRAMAHYVASFAGSGAIDDSALQVEAEQRVAHSARQAASLIGPAQRLFEGACGACHHDGDGPDLLGTNSPLALNSNLHSDRPDNLLRTILDGVREPATRELGFMPAFRHSLDDRQIAQLAAWMRSRFAPERAAWSDLEAVVGRVRALPPAD